MKLVLSVLYVTYNTTGITDASIGFVVSRENSV